MDALLVIAALLIWLLINPFWAILAAILVSAIWAIAAICRQFPLVRVFLRALFFGS